MTKRRSAKKHPDVANRRRHTPIAATSTLDGPGEQPRSGREEVLRQAEALVSRATAFVMSVGFGNELYWPGRVQRPDRFQVRIVEEAVDLAVDHLSKARQDIAAEMAKELHAPLDAQRQRYKVLEPTPRDEPEPPGWFMPPEDDEPLNPLQRHPMKRAPQPAPQDPVEATSDDPNP